MIETIQKGLHNPPRLANYALQRTFGDCIRWSRITLLNLSTSIDIDPSTYISLRASIFTDYGELSIGENCELFSDCKIIPMGGFINLGDRVSVNPFTILYGHGGLEIGNDVSIAAHSTLIPGNHLYSDPNTLISDQGHSKKGITIEDDVWIGAGCRILDGVTIGEGSVIAAGSVVTESIPSYTVAAGSPAEPIKNRE